MSQSNSTPVTMPGSPLSETISVDIPNQLNDNMDGVEMGDANDVSPTISVVQTLLLVKVLLLLKLVKTLLPMLYLTLRLQSNH
jgi:hypothetical protein